MRPGAAMSGRPGSGLWRLAPVLACGALLLALSSSLVSARQADEEADAESRGGAGARAETEVRLSPSVGDSLAQLQDRWLLINSAYLRGDESLLTSAVTDLRSTLEILGFERSPELSLSLLARGLEALRRGDPERAELGFRLAEELDPGSAAVQFARAKAQWEQGSYPGATISQVRGLAQALADRAFLRLALRNLAVWLMLSLLISAAVYIALQFATKGAQLLKDLRSLVPMLPPMVGGLLAITVLLAPIFLPSGWLWVGFLWGVLLWGYGSSSERWVTALSILLLGAIPTAFSILAADLPMVGTSENRLLDSLSDESLYGLLLEDLAEFEDQAGDDPASLHLLADVHSELGQDDVARPYYRRVVDQEPFNGDALNNLGVFHSRRREDVAAIEFLQVAAEIESSRMYAAYNLSRIYDRLLEFGNSQRYLALARQQSPDIVAEWENEDLQAVSTLGGFGRISDLRDAIEDRRRGAWASLRDHLEPLVLAVAALLMAFVLPWLGFGSGGWRATDPAREGTTGVWVRRLVPGLRSAEAGDGGRAFLGVLLPTSVALSLVAGFFGYGLPWGLEPGRSLLLVAALSLLAIFFAVRAVTR